MEPEIRTMPKTWRQAGIAFFFAFDIRNGAEQISPLIWAAVANEMGISPASSIALNYILDLEKRRSHAHL